MPVYHENIMIPKPCVVIIVPHKLKLSLVSSATPGFMCRCFISSYPSNCSTIWQLRLRFSWWQRHSPKWKQLSTLTQDEFLRVKEVVSVFLQYHKAVFNFIEA